MATFKYNLLAEDAFRRVDENPLDPSKWATITFSDLALQLKSHRAVSVQSVLDSGAFYEGISFPSYPNQYVEATIGSWASNSTSNGTLQVLARASDDESAVYVMGIFNSGGNTIVIEGGGITLQVLSPRTVKPGDRMRIECFGPLITFLYNDIILYQQVDPTPVLSGKVGIIVGTESVIGDTSFSHFAAGSIDGQPFLGSVTEVGSAPAGDPFIGTVTVVGSAPAGVPNPYLGKIRVVVSPPSGPPNPALGQVVVVGSAPAGDPNPYLGNAITN